jgi:hypothetical protein
MVGEVNPGRGHRDVHTSLAWGVGIGALLQAEHRRITVLGDNYCSHGR